MTTPSKRARENKKARKKRDKEERRWQRREEGPRELEVVTAEELRTHPVPSVEEILENMAGGGGRMSAPAIPSKLFVGGLSYDTDNRSLKAAFEQHGEVLEAVVIQDPSTGRSRGFGFVTLASHKDANRVIKAMDGARVDGRAIAVNVANDRR